MKLTPAQKRMLQRIVATNGGGIAEFNLNHRTMWALYEKGLIQGKAGAQWRAVHTREGLNLIKNTKEKIDLL